MEIMLFCLVMAYIVKNGATDVIDALHDRTPARYVTAQKRADARAHRARSRAGKYKARTGRAPRRSTVRPYLKALWHDAVEDAHKKHNKKREDRMSAPVPEPANVRVDRPDDVAAPTVRPRTTEAAPDTTGRAEANEDEVEPADITHKPTDDTQTPTVDDGDHLATVTPITEGIRPMTASTTEVTGITSAIAWAQQTGGECTEAVTTVERLGAFFKSNEFPELATKAAQMQERFSSLAADCDEIVNDLQRFLSVKEQWAAVDNQGTKEAIVNE